MEDGHIDGNAYIQVVIENDSLMIFLDTGNPDASIDLHPRTLERIKFEYTGDTIISWDYMGHEYISRSYILPKVEIGGLEISNIHGTEHKIRYESDGTFSFKFLENYNVLIDYPNKNMRLYNLGYLPTYLNQGNWEQVDAFDRGGFRLPLSFRGLDREVVFTIDNAAIALDDEQKPYGLIRAESFLGSFLIENNLIVTKEDDPAIIGIFSTGEFELNSNLLPNLNFMIVDYKFPDSDGLLGYNFFIKYPMFIDFQQKKLYIKLG